jgi:hypothetical protein
MRFQCKFCKAEMSEEYVRSFLTAPRFHDLLCPLCREPQGIKYEPRACNEVRERVTYLPPPGRRRRFTENHTICPSCFTAFHSKDRHHCPFCYSSVSQLRGRSRVVSGASEVSPLVKILLRIQFLKELYWGKMKNFERTFLELEGADTLEAINMRTAECNRGRFILSCEMKNIMNSICTLEASLKKDGCYL